MSRYIDAEQKAYKLGFKIGQQMAKTKRDFEKVNKAVWTEAYREQIEELTKELSAIDNWHPASDPPTDKDFEPTGQIQAWFAKPLNGQQVWHLEKSEMGNSYVNFTHWRKITPPKQ